MIEFWRLATSRTRQEVAAAVGAVMQFSTWKFFPRAEKENAMKKVARASEASRETDRAQPRSKLLNEKGFL